MGDLTFLEGIVCGASFFIILLLMEISSKLTRVLYALKHPAAE